jgi:RNA-directed DNA polymerase
MNSSHRRQLAKGLADALLAGVPTLQSGIQRVAKILGEQPAWLARLVYESVIRFAHVWHPSQRAALTEFIVGHWASIEGFDSNNLSLRSYTFNAPLMAAPNGAIGRLALPDIPAVGDLAHWLGVGVNELAWLADIQGRNSRFSDGPLQHYRVSALPKRDGNWRLVEAPKSRLRKLQRRLLDDLLDFVPVHEAAHGFRRCRSPLTHARQHAGKAIVMRLDLEDFFPSIGRARVAAVFRTIGYPPGVALYLASLCTTQTRRPALEAALRGAGYRMQSTTQWQNLQRYRTPHLPQGAPSSPALSNLCAFRLDLRLASAAEAADAVFSRYADDLTFSGGPDFARGAERFGLLVTRIADEEGFRVNTRKTRLMRASTRQRVTGLVVNHAPAVARDEYERLKAIVHNCLRHGPESQNREASPRFRDHLGGRIAHLGFVNPARGARVRAAFDRISWPDAPPLDPQGEALA